MKLFGCKFRPDNLDKLFSLLFKLVLTSGVLIIFSYSISIGYYPAGLTLGDGLLFIAATLAFGLIYSLMVSVMLGVGILFSWWLFRIYWCAKKKRGVSFRIYSPYADSVILTFCLIVFICTLLIIDGKNAALMAYMTLLIAAIYAVFFKLSDHEENGAGACACDCFVIRKLTQVAKWICSLKILSFFSKVRSLIVKLARYIFNENEAPIPKAEKPENTKKVKLFLALTIYFTPLALGSFNTTLLVSSMLLTGVRTSHVEVFFKDEYKKFLSASKIPDLDTYNVNILFRGAGSSSVIDLCGNKFIVPNDQFFYSQKIKETEKSEKAVSTGKTNPACTTAKQVDKKP